MNKKAWISLLITGLLTAGIILLGLEVSRNYKPADKSRENTTSGGTETVSPEVMSSEPDSATETNPDSDSTSEPETTEPETETTEPDSTEPETEPVEPDTTGPESESTEPDTTVPADPPAERRLIFLGDSRTVGLYCSQAFSKEEAEGHYFYHIGEEMYASLGPVTYVAHGGTGYEWLSTYTFARAVTWNEEEPSYIFWFGINDVYNIENYIAYINNVVITYGRPVYYLTLGPTREDAPAGYTNDEIEAFNRRLVEGLDPSVHIIDTYSFIRGGLSTGDLALSDQMHYTYETYQAIYDYIMVNLTPDTP